MPYTDDWNTTDPAGSVQAAQIDDQIRKLRVQLDERLGDVMRGTGMLLDPVQLKAVTGFTYDTTQAPGAMVTNYTNPCDLFVINFVGLNTLTDSNGLVFILKDEIPDPKPDFSTIVGGLAVAIGSSGGFISFVVGIGSATVDGDLEFTFGPLGAGIPVRLALVVVRS